MAQPAHTTSAPPAGAAPMRRRALAPFQLPVADDLHLVDEQLIELLSSNAGLIGEVAGHVMVGVGKKFRPTLLLLSAQAAGPPPSTDDARRARVRAAAVVELVHTATLIHDDSIDKSLLRRGLPTVNHVWNDDVSVIMGDYMYSKAFSTLVHTGLWDAMRILADTTNQMSVGEMMQIERRHNADVTEAEYIETIGNKTASLVAASCAIGAQLGGGAMTERLERYGHHVGLVFQITDDVIDYIGEEQDTGKPRGTDVREGKITLPLIHALHHAPPRRAADMRALILSGEISETDWSGILSFIDEYGGVDYARERAQSLAERARAELAGLPATEAREALLGAVDYVLARRS